MRKIIVTFAIFCAAMTGCVYHKGDGPEVPGGAANAPTVNGGSSTGAAMDAYRAAMGKVVGPTADATDAWSAEMDKQSKLDASRLSRDAVLSYARAALDVATKLHAAAAAATTAIRDVVPPEPCVNTHVLTLEALQLTERGSLDAKEFMEGALGSGNPDRTLIDSANDLLSQADRAKVKAQAAATRDGCPLYK